MYKEKIMLAIVVWNVIVFFIFGIDKKKAIDSHWRIPEKNFSSVHFCLVELVGCLE